MISQIPTERQLIPAVFEGAGVGGQYDYEPEEEAILAELDPDRLGKELPPDMPESARGEWEEFVALCDRLDAKESSSSTRREGSDRSAGCM